MQDVQAIGLTTLLPAGEASTRADTTPVHTALQPGPGRTRPSSAPGAPSRVVVWQDLLHLRPAVAALSSPRGLPAGPFPAAP